MSAKATEPPSRSAGLWQSLRGAVARGDLWLALHDHYRRRGLDWQAIYAARQARRCDPGSDVELPPGDGDDSRLGRESLPEAADLAARFAAAVAEDPGDWLSWLYLARLRELLGQAESPPTAFGQAVALEPIAGESRHWLGVWRLNAGDAAGAVAALTPLAAQNPPRHGSLMYLGEALLRTGQAVAAEKAFERAAQSANPDVLLGLAARVFGHNYWHEAIGILGRVLELRPDHVPALKQLAKIHWEVYQLGEAEAVCRRLDQLEPGNEDARLMLAALPGRRGDAAAHLAAVRAEYAAAGNPQSRLASSIAMAALYVDSMTPSEVADLHRELCAPIAAALAPTPAGDFANPRTGDRRLRIGYVSGDFHRQHPVNLFMLPVLQRHDRARFEVCIYHTGSMHDEYTRMARACADRWLEAAALDDRALRAAIVADGIDILVDLAGHTSTHRLGVFALRAAPVQATYLGYPHSTGLTTIDWLIGDTIVSPAGHAHLFSEGIVQLPDSVFCWAPVDDYPLPPPRPATAPVVFASFNNAMKLSPATLDLWANVVLAVPDAQLLLKAPSFRDDGVKARFTQLLGERGLPPERLILRGPSGLADMMQEYGEVDIGLDPTPYNGGTTTLQALWMGVPVVTLAGGNFVSRMGASFLTTLGDHDCIAADADAYVAAAVRLAAGVGALRAGRAERRRRLAASPLCDIARHVAAFEAGLRAMWDAHCRGDATRLIRVEAPPAANAAPSPLWQRGVGGDFAARKAATAVESEPPQIPPVPPFSKGGAKAPPPLWRRRTTEAPTAYPNDAEPRTAPMPPESTPQPALEITTSRQFLAWMAEQKLSLALTTYQIGKLFFLGLKDNNELSVFERSFNRCMGLCPSANGLYLSSLYQVWRFENLFNHGETQDGYDRLYLPQVGWTTGDLDIHDMAVDADGRLVFVNTLFGCLATLSETHSFKPLWRPPFLSKLAAEDRCHLNGLAMRDGRPAFVTAVGASDVVDGWREHRAGGGIVIDVQTSAIVAQGLSMPHSPRWYRDRLWLLNSGTGEFGHVDLASGRFVPLCFCAGYLRGLAFHGDYAIVGLSKPRHNKTFSGLPLDAALEARKAEPRCGLQVIDLRTGDAVHWLRIEGIVEELYDVVALPGVRRPMALGFKTDEIRRVLSVDE